MKKYILNIILIIAVIIVIYCIFSIYKTYKDNNQTEEITEKIYNEIINDIPISDEKINEKIENNNNYNDNSLDLSLGFNKLSTINNDVVAWIKISNTNINYPIVQTNNNDYYLNHSFDKTENQNGWPFLNYNNSSNFSDQNTVLFGHNTNGTTMFSQLKNIYNGEFGKSVKVFIYLKDNVIEYQVFSIYLEDPNNVNSISKYITNDTINQNIKKSKINFEVKVTDQDNILTLSTCNNVTNDRIIMQAKKI